MTYTFKWKHGWQWRKLKTVVGHRIDRDLDRMDVFLQDGGIYSIPQWSLCTLRLGTDWVLFTKSQMESESGQTIDLKAGVGR